MLLELQKRGETAKDREVGLGLIIIKIIIGLSEYESRYQFWLNDPTKIYRNVPFIIYYSLYLLFFCFPGGN